jgi:hypothetical protein
MSGRSMGFIAARIIVTLLWVVFDFYMALDTYNDFGWMITLSVTSILILLFGKED